VNRYNLNRRSIQLCLILFLFPLAAGAQSPTDPNNDLLGSLGLHDPCTIIKENGTYYAWATGGGGLTSKDRKTWARYSGPSLTAKQSWWDAHGGEMWAPDVTYMNGKYYCYYSVSAWGDYNSAIGLSTSPTLDPATAKWTDQGMVINAAQGADGGGVVNVIDPSTIVDEDGKWYLAFGSFKSGVRLAELNTQTGLLMNNNPHPYKVSPRSGEGSAAVRIGKYVYYAVSQGTCCKGMESTYYISMARATTIAGPYANKGGTAGSFEKILGGSNNSNASSGAVAVGVGGFFWDGRGAENLDTLFMDYMAYTAPSGGALLNIKPMYMDANSWLSFEKGTGTVVTRTHGTTAVRPQERITISPPASANAGAHLWMNLGGNAAAENPAALYELSGQKIPPQRKTLSTGIFIHNRSAR
jgi:arabinan endo-1,5-alpha-L-arabinosidase